MKIARLMWLAVATVVCTAVLAQATATDQPFSQPVSHFYEKNSVYELLPIGVALLGLVIGILWHQALVRGDAVSWPGAASGSFLKLCTPPLILATLLLLGVVGLFVYIAFGSPASADEWPSHAKTAYRSLAIAAAIAYLPWLITLKGWRES